MSNAEQLDPKDLKEIVHTMNACVTTTRLEKYLAAIQAGGGMRRITEETPTRTIGFTNVIELGIKNKKQHDLVLLPNTQLGVVLSSTEVHEIGVEVVISDYGEDEAINALCRVLLKLHNEIVADYKARHPNTALA